MPRPRATLAAGTNAPFHYFVAWCGGVLCFVCGAHGLAVQVDGVTISFNVALAIALLPALAYGVGPTLVSATLGAAALMPLNAWPQNGLANTGAAVAIFVWLVGHARAAELHAATPRPATHPLLVELPLALFYAVIIYWAYPPLLALNDPASCPECTRSMSEGLRLSLALKTFLLLYVQTTLASSLLLVNGVRRVLGIPSRPHAEGNGRIVASALLGGVALWLASVGLGAVFAGERVVARLRHPLRELDDVMTLIVLVTASLIAAQGLAALMERVRRHALELRAQVEAVHASEESLQHVVDGVNDAILVLDRESGALLRENAGARRLLGTTPDEIVWNGLGGFLPRGSVERDGGTLCAELAATAAANDPSRLFTARNAGGETFAALASVHETRMGGRGVFVCTVRDVTAQRRTEDELAHARKLDAIGRLAGGVAHDFNNLLGAMMSATGTLALDLADSPKHREALTSLRRAGEQAQGLTQQLLDFARKGTRVDLPFDVHESLSAAAALLSRTLPKDIRLIVEPAATRSEVRGDPSQIQGALINLAMNASDAMPQGGELRIATRDLEAEGHPIAITVSDTGEGIPSEHLPHIFEPFFTTKAPGRGTGLGLASVYAAVQQAGGQISVESEPGVGTRFEITLPSATESKGPVALEESLPATVAVGQVLVVDDDELVRVTTSALLERLGYTVLQASDGERAEALFREHAAAIDVVVLDALMPGMSGRECFTRLRAIQPDARVVLCSGYASEADVSALQREGVRAILQKPFRVDALRTAIEAARVGEGVLVATSTGK